ETADRGHVGEVDRGPVEPLGQFTGGADGEIVGAAAEGGHPPAVGRQPFDQHSAQAAAAAADDRDLGLFVVADRCRPPGRALGHGHQATFLIFLYLPECWSASEISTSTGTLNGSSRDRQYSCTLRVTSRGSASAVSLRVAVTTWPVTWLRRPETVAST